MNVLLRALIGVAMCIVTGAPALAQAPEWAESYGQLLGKYATPGGVKYAEWKTSAGDLQALQGVVEAIASAEVASMEKKAQLAFYLNAYNAWILHEALEKYPAKSVKDFAFTFFTSKRIKVAGEEMSFNHLEKEIILPKFGEPRVHFALNCASRSCPPLLAEVFRADKLEAQFEKLAKAFVNSENGVKYLPEKKTAELSAIFDWYKDDFKAGGGALEFINKRRAKTLPKEAKISYQKYDWSLNEAK